MKRSEIEKARKDTQEFVMRTWERGYATPVTILGETSANLSGWWAQVYRDSDPGLYAATVTDGDSEVTLTLPRQPWAPIKQGYIVKNQKGDRYYFVTARVILGTKQQHDENEARAATARTEYAAREAEREQQRRAEHLAVVRQDVATLAGYGLTLPDVMRRDEADEALSGYYYTSQREKVRDALRIAVLVASRDESQIA